MRPSLPSLLSALLVLLAVLPQAEAAPNRRREEQKQAEDLRKAHEELKLQQRQLEEVKVKRWQDKRNAVAAQEAFSEAWNETKADMDRLSQAKNQKEEMLLRLENQEAEKQAEVKEIEDRFKQFGLQVQEKVLEFGSEVENGFPYRQAEMIGQVNALKKEMEGKGSGASPGVLETFFGLQLQRFRLGETREVLRGRLAVKGLASLPEDKRRKVEKTAPESEAKVVAGHFIRVGTVYQGFVSSEGPDVAILGKTGRIEGKTWDWVEALPEANREDLRKAASAFIRAEGTAASGAAAAGGVAGSGGNPQVTGGAASLVLLPMDVLLKKATGEGFTTEKTHSWFSKFLEEFKVGGFVMWPIFALAFVGLFIVIERIIVFISRDQNAARLSRRCLALVQEGRPGEARELCRKKGGAVGRVLGAVLEQADKGREEAEARAHEVMLHETPRLERRISTMNILAAAAPLIGLFGTVTGMVTVFDVITVHGTNNPKMMADGIAEALIATKWGLGIAIPILLLYNFLDNWSIKIVTNMEKYAAQMVNALFPVAGGARHGAPERREMTAAAEAR